MSKQYTAVLTLPILASGAIVAERFVAPSGAQAAAAGNSIGVALQSAADKATVPVIHLGTAVVEAGAAVAKGDLLESDASGRAITKAAGVAVARALQAAGALGDFIEVALIPN